MKQQLSYSGSHERITDLSERHEVRVAFWATVGSLVNEPYFDEDESRRLARNGAAWGE